MKFTFDLISNFRRIGFGIEVGNNTTYYGKKANIYLEINFIFFLFGFELDWTDSLMKKKKYN